MCFYDHIKHLSGLVFRLLRSAMGLAALIAVIALSYKTKIIFWRVQLKIRQFIWLALALIDQSTEFLVSIQYKYFSWFCFPFKKITFYQHWHVARPKIVSNQWKIVQFFDEATDQAAVKFVTINVLNFIIWIRQ